MVIDVLFIVFLIVFFIRGYKKGFVIALFAVFSIIIGVLCALKFSSIISSLLFSSASKGSAWVPFISYIIVFSITVWLVRLGAKAIDKAMEVVFLGWINRFAGAITYGFLAAFIFSTFLWLIDKLGIISTDTQLTSKSYTVLVSFAPKMFYWLGELLPFVKHTIDDLSSFFDRINSRT